jgi:hypothetical protein
MSQLPAQYPELVEKRGDGHERCEIGIALKRVSGIAQGRESRLPSAASVSPVSFAQITEDPTQ